MYVGGKNSVQLCTNETYFPDDASGRLKKEKGMDGQNKFLEIDLPSYLPSVSAWAGLWQTFIHVLARKTTQQLALKATVFWTPPCLHIPTMEEHS
jgi:hypothetical protein